MLSRKVAVGPLYVCGLMVKGDTHPDVSAASATVAVDVVLAVLPAVSIATGASGLPNRMANLLAANRCPRASAPAEATVIGDLPSWPASLNAPTRAPS